MGETGENTAFSVPCEFPFILIMQEGDLFLFSERLGCYVQHNNLGLQLLITASAASETTLAINDFTLAIMIAIDIIICKGNGGKVAFFVPRLHWHFRKSCWWKMFRRLPLKQGQNDALKYNPASAWNVWNQQYLRTFLRSTRDLKTFLRSTWVTSSD